MKNLINKLGPVFYVWLIAFFMVTFVLVAALLIFLNNPDKNRNNYVVKTSPLSGSSLNIGTKPIIKVVFKQSPQSIYKIIVLYTDAASNKPDVNIETNSAHVGDNSINVVFLEKAVPLGIYTLNVLRKSDNQVVFTGTYLTGDATPSPVISNNQNLIPFLPHNAPNYTLEYFKNKNIYVFHFIYDVNSALSIDEQFNKAKNDALLFIKSKNVNPDSLVVDWRNS